MTESQSPQEVSRARAIFNASQEVKPFDPADFDFAMNEEEPSFEITPAGPALSRVRRSPCRLQSRAARNPWHDAHSTGNRRRAGSGAVLHCGGFCLLLFCIYKVVNKT